MTTPINDPEKLVRAEAAAAKTASQRGPMARLRNYFLTGLVVTGPVAVTIWLTWSFITWVDNVLRPIMPPALRPETYLPFPVPGTGLILALVALTLIGFLTANLIGRTLVGWGERLLGHMPIVRPIYKMMKQIFETLFAKNGSNFRQVALVEFPAPGMWSLVFLSQEPSEEIAGRLPKTDHVSAFLPCTPNPTTGFFFFVPRKDLVALDLTVESAMTLLISAGMVQPDAKNQDRLAAMAATARASQAARRRKRNETVQ